ncbi:hypothetical protein LUZ61_016294 [Rhynchospora tenuis]|uniref:Thioredoxin n=1 Tax=Rhynchospora tenuis TaxID=198213 RepID=A0AAD5Z588_9POAL|nr:hypothetical protein LUZ61_016294 [Rhynchospora tenuis]
MTDQQGSIVEVTSTKDFAEKINDANKTVVHFTAEWSGPSRGVSPTFDKLSKEYSSLVFLKVDIDNLPDVAREWSIRSLPAVNFFQGERKIDGMIGTSTKPNSRNWLPSMPLLLHPNSP